MRNFPAPTPLDLASVARQLGRRPRGIVGVVRRSRWGYPQIVMTAPLVARPSRGSARGAGSGEYPEGGESQSSEDLRTEPGAAIPELEVFPTQFWLTCPFLREAIGTLESAGWIQRWEERLRSDVQLREAMERSHREAAAFRLQLISPEVRRLLEGEPRYRGLWQVLTETGVAGIRGGPQGTSFGVKCLHAHYADWVARGDNPIGAWVAEALREQGIDEGCDPDCPARCAP